MVNLLFLFSVIYTRFFFFFSFSFLNSIFKNISSIITFILLLRWSCSNEANNLIISCYENGWKETNTFLFSLFSSMCAVPVFEWSEISSSLILQLPFLCYDSGSKSWIGMSYLRPFFIWSRNCYEQWTIRKEKVYVIIFTSYLWLPPFTSSWVTKYEDFSAGTWIG